MKRNNKGFTLVELLATIVILGILAVFSIPVITGMLDRSRNRIYINDAKKLISQAEYQLRNSSDQVESPDPDNCIVMSLLFLDNGTFDSAPNKGKYDREHSYVVVRNTNGTLDYAVTLVENISGNSFKGVDLIEDTTLNSSSSLKYIKTFKRSELINLDGFDDEESSNDDKIISAKYLNEKLGSSYLSSGTITAVYNYRNVYNGNAVSGDSFNPKIVKARLQSENNYNSLNVMLTVNATDADTPKKDLMVYYSFGSYKKLYGKSYGKEDVFSTKININSIDEKYQFDLRNGGTINLYVTVEDPDGNMARKMLTYDIHKNEPPEISNDSAITKRSTDTVNMTTALVNFIVSDDIDPLDKLKVCVIEFSSNEVAPTSCSDDKYKDYKQYFNGTTMEHTFCGGKCKRDGSSHGLVIFVKDSFGEVAYKRLDYTFSTNTPPKLKKVVKSSRMEAFTNNESKNIVLKVDADDDLDTGKTLTVTITDGVSDKSYPYSENPDDNYFDFTVDGKYDGSTKKITVTVTDSEGESASQTLDHKLYKNLAPTIEKYKVVSAENICTNINLCGDNNAGGSTNINVELQAKDDIDYEDDYKNLKVCVSELESDCDNDANYVSYNNYYKHNFTQKTTLKHSSLDGSEVTVHVYVKDSDGLYDKKTQKYKLYSNLSPKIISHQISSKTEGTVTSGTRDITINLRAEDDSDDDLKVTISGGKETLEKTYSADALQKGVNIGYHVSDVYDGKSKTISIVVSDVNGAQDSSKDTYKLYLNTPPVISEVNIDHAYQLFDLNNVTEENRKKLPCNNVAFCYDKNTYAAKYTVLAEDELDDADSLKICVSQNQNDCSDDSNFVSYSNYYDKKNAKVIEKTYTFTEEEGTALYKTKNNNKTLYIVVKDSLGGVTSKNVNYQIYGNQAPALIGEVEVVSNSEIEDVNAPSVTYKIGVRDDYDTSMEISFCYKKDDKTTCPTNYQNKPYVSSDGSRQSYVLGTDFFGTSDYTGETYNIYAIVKDSFGDTLETEEIAYKLYEDQPPVIHYISGSDESSNYEIFSASYEDAYYKDGEVLDDNALKKLEEDLASLTDEEKNKRLKAITIERTIYVSFKVTDYEDYYNVCVTDNNKTCTNYSSTKYNGNETKSQTYTYTETIAGEELDTPVGLYLFVKDTKGNLVISDARDLTVKQKKCKNVITDPNDSTKTICKDDEYEDVEIKITASTILTRYEKCAASSPDHVKYNYTFKSGTEITMDSCEGKCYHKSYSNQLPDNDIVAYYTQTITFTDRYKNVTCTKCLSDNGTERECVNNYTAYCDFKDCFKKGESYDRAEKIIGTEKVEDDSPWTVEINGKITTCTAHYRKYTSSYDESDSNITLTEIKDAGFCAELVDDKATYAYKSGDENPYIRIADGGESDSNANGGE